VLAGLDLAVCGSAFGEAFPNAVAEAMACEVPVVATDVGDTRVLLEGIGEVVPPRSPGRLAAAVLSVLGEDADDRATRGRLARQRVIDRYSLAAVAAAYQDLYEAVVSGVPREKTSSLQPWRPAQVTSQVSWYPRAR
jgi:glycosyltransferase involved in cell wall biosynthesis